MFPSQPDYNLAFYLCQKLTALSYIHPAILPVHRPHLEGLERETNFY